MEKLSILSLTFLSFLLSPVVSTGQFVIIGDSVTTTYVSLDPDSVCWPTGFGTYVQDSVFIDIDNNGVNDFRFHCSRIMSPGAGTLFSSSIASMNGSMLLSLLTMGDTNCDSILDSVVTYRSVPTGDSIFIYQPGFVSQLLPFSVSNWTFCQYGYGILSYPAYIPFQMQSGGYIFVGWFRFINPFDIDSYAYNSIPVSVPENSEVQYNIYPNPIMNDFNIRFKRTGRFNISLKDITGRTIFSQFYEGNHFQTDLSKFSKGIYLLELESGQTTVSEKIVIR